MRHPEGGYVLQTLAGVERITDAYGREVLVLHFGEGHEPVAVMLTNYSRPEGPPDEGLDWLTAALEEGDDGTWGSIPQEESDGGARGD